MNTSIAELGTAHGREQQAAQHSFNVWPRGLFDHAGALHGGARRPRPSSPEYARAAPGTARQQRAGRSDQGLHHAWRPRSPTPTPRLFRKYGFQRLVAMLTEACDHGLESIPSAPPELVRFIGEMEQLPAWLDRKLIERGRADRAQRLRPPRPFRHPGRPHRHLHEQIRRFADGADRRPVEANRPHAG